MYFPLYYMLFGILEFFPETGEVHSCHQDTLTRLKLNNRNNYTKNDFHFWNDSNSSYCLFHFHRKKASVDEVLYCIVAMTIMAV